MDERTQTRVRHWLQRADEYLRAAELEFNGEFYARSISTSYYAMFFAATAALESIGVKRDKHRGVISAFGEQFVKTGKINREIGRTFSQVERDREESDYSAIPAIDNTLAQTRLSEARQFVAAVQHYLSEQGLKFE